MMMFNATPDDIQSLMPVLKKGRYKEPNMKMSIYKNRQGRYKDILLWVDADKGSCRFRVLFATNYSYELIPIEGTKIYITPKMLVGEF